MELVNPKRFSIVLINLDPTVGSEIKKIRPCTIISPDSMNLSKLSTVIIAPLTSAIKNNFPTRINVNFNNREGQIALDQIRAIDKSRIIKILGNIEVFIQNRILEILQEIFS